LAIGLGDVSQKYVGDAVVAGWPPRQLPFIVLFNVLVVTRPSAGGDGARCLPKPIKSSYYATEGQGGVRRGRDRLLGVDPEHRRHRAQRGCTASFMALFPSLGLLVKLSGCCATPHWRRRRCHNGHVVDWDCWLVAILVAGLITASSA
jgi:hypothetical protein